jgi:hypothetical protein
MDIEQQLVYVLLAALLSVLITFVFKIKKAQTQILIFSMNLITLFIIFCFYQSKQKDKQQKDKQQKDKTKPPQLKNYEFTDDSILPVKSYNPDDCTNDGTCIIPADISNLYGFHEKKGVNPFKAMDKSKITNHTCLRCKRPLTLENNPVTELFKETCSCHSCTHMKKEVMTNNQLCIYCKTAYLQSHPCFSPKGNVPQEFYGNTNL